MVGQGGWGRSGDMGSEWDLGGVWRGWGPYEDMGSEWDLGGVGGCWDLVGCGMGTTWG